jgi:16S rRNA (adenine1518-N6/adenine1519-N6)-dimethyltransferase
MRILNNPKKSLGQNFLVDNNIINKITKIVNIDKNKSILEIGCGYGSLTKSILKFNPKNIVAIEKDKKLSILLREEFINNKNITIINKDILEILKIKSSQENIIVFGNLPYNISTKILTSLILLKKWPPWYDTLILMFQKEVADRIIAKTHTKEFGRLSILCNWRLEVKKHFDVSKNCFFPKPKVNSSVLSFTPKKKEYYNLINPKNLELVTRILFSNRRKMINKSFKKLFVNNELIAKKLNIDLSKRPEQLSCETFYKIATAYEKLLG